MFCTKIDIKWDILYLGGIMFLVNKYYDVKYGRIVASALNYNGAIYKGKTHADCFKQEPIGVLKCAEQGFITSNNVFVNREKALKIAKHYKQIKHKHPPHNQLMSEDLL